ncbi:hypothetical protein Psal006b_03324 (plasmid) [Piscirickettsia salmonis]|uniref:Uncharacterized protein n=2 Tax=Piscirickettsia salmonis TaxID=1238 RepID=A0A1L6THY8_PISSA|nr:hypothetical protein [Piscirickettsia salmonis]AKP74893.1 hypothetical protein PSLF89_1p68 [Piscirickettsia salmonis LF-89 = ATCC VR-1361]ALB24481.1 hypothetical protein KU39_3p19 [Piscirickettsia salmonis]ALY04390.1 hypothetical protein AWE47_15790 [Piscirickettsia salmonis]AMA43876.1 hypothetical protein AWJ11_15895 [Piscirickettsia salmonis]AOS37096.1 hypothetical protein AVM72_17235 [Piscirickettsia salmonis]
MLSFYNVLEKYLIFFKKACLDPSSSFDGRESVTFNGSRVKLENIFASLQDQEIQDKFKDLKEKIKYSDNDQALELTTSFSDFLLEKTSYKFDVARIMGFFVDFDIIQKNVFELFFLEAVSFTATADLHTYFEKKIEKCLLISMEDESSNAKELLFEQFKEASNFVVNLFDHSRHTVLFQKLENAGLSDDSLCLFEALNKSNNQISSEKLSQLKQSLDAIDDIFNSREVDIFSEASNVDLLKSSYDNYRLDMKKCIISGIFSLESQEELEVKFINYEANFLESSDLGNNISGNFRSLLPDILKKINNTTDNNQESESLFFYNRLQQRNSSSPEVQHQVERS